jgi:hypothetical protein
MLTNEIPYQNVIAISCPGGLAQQFRVQVAAEGTHPTWQLAGSFRDAQLAQQCAAKLNTEGQTSRIVAYRSLPTAA